MHFAAASIPAASVMVMPDRISASGMLGVTTSAMGRSCPVRIWMALSCSSLEPEVATITGSTTMCLASYWRSFLAMVSMSADDDTMPILMASG